MKENEQSQLQSLIPGLPDEIALDCLARLPYRFHSGLKSVCRGWKGVFAHPSFYRQRKIAGRGEEFVCLVQALVPNPNAEAESDPGKDKSPPRHAPPVYGLTIYSVRDATWHRMPSQPHVLSAGIPTFSHCVAVGSKLVLIGGWDPLTLDSVADVYVYDFVRGGGWRLGAPMSAARSFFACATDGSTVYVAGGHDNQKNALRTAEAYDVDADTWREIPPMIEERDECQGLVCRGGRFWVVSGYGTDSQGRFSTGSECYDPVKRLWTRLDGVWPFTSASPKSSCGPQKGGKPSKSTDPPSLQFPPLVYLDSKYVREFDEVDANWKTVALIPDTLSSPACVAYISSNTCSDRIFVIGSGSNNGGGRQRHQACVLDMVSRKWTQVDTPVEYSGFAYSATSLYL